MRFIGEFLKTVREVRVEAPERIEIIPPVIPKIGVDENAALLPKLLAKSAHRRERLFTRKALLDRQIVAVYTVIVPVVVMRQDAIRMGALVIEVGAERAAKLLRVLAISDNIRKRHRLARSESINYGNIGRKRIGRFSLVSSRLLRS